MSLLYDYEILIRLKFYAWFIQISASKNDILSSWTYVFGIQIVFFRAEIEMN